MAKGRDLTQRVGRQSAFRNIPPATYLYLVIYFSQSWDVAAKSASLSNKYPPRQGINILPLNIYLAATRAFVISESDLRSVTTVGRRGFTCAALEPIPA